MGLLIYITRIFSVNVDCFACQWSLDWMGIKKPTQTSSDQAVELENKPHLMQAGGSFDSMYCNIYDMRHQDTTQASCHAVKHNIVAHACAHA